MNTFVFDLDGTLLNSNIEVSEKNKNALKRIIDNKDNLILASGRMYSSMIHIIDNYIPFVKNYAHIVSYNGSYVVDKENQVLIEEGVNADVAVDIVKYLRNKNLHRQIYVKDELIVEEDNQEIKDYAKHASVKYEVVYDLVDYINKNKNLPLKLLAVGENSKLLDVQRDLNIKFGNFLNIIMSFHSFLDIIPKNTSKGIALEKLSKIYDFDLRNAHIFGDSENDIAMLEKTNNSYAMGNANDKVQRIAKYTVPSNDEEGVAYAVEKIINNGIYTD
jgi:Cof subfamily protein (haloacid dehalogenase superfamily)